MRRIATLALLALAASACDDSPVEPPSDLAVRVTRTSVAVVFPPPAPAIAAAGDSIVADGVVSVSGCYDEGVVAGREGGAVVITLTSRENGYVCAAVIAHDRFRIVVDGAPSGTYEVIWRHRITKRDGQERSSRVLVSQTVQLP